MHLAGRLSPRTSERRSPLMAGYLYYCMKYTSFCLLYAHPDSSAATRTRPDSYSSRAFVSSHSRKLANAQTERSVAATSTVLVTESELGSGYLFCYVTAENWNITIRLNFIAICGIILLISIVFLKSIPNNNMNL